MFIVNITFQVPHNHYEKWRELILHLFIPACTGTEKISGYRFQRVLTQTDPEGASYCLQFLAESPQTAQNLTTKTIEQAISKMQKDYPEPLLHFVTILKEIPL